MEKKRPQLNVDELHQLKWLLGGALTLISVWTVFYMDVEAWTLMAVTTLATIAGLVWPALPARVPALAHTLAFPAIVSFFALDVWLKSEVLPAMVRLDMLLLLYRGLSYRQRRDDLQIIILGLFLIVVAGVLTVSIAFAAQILIFTGCALAFLLTITLCDVVTGKSPAIKPLPTEVPAWARQVNWPRLLRRMGEVADWRVATLGVILFAGVVGVSALLFIAIPRFQLDNGMFLDRFISKKAKTGFSDSIKFGDVTDIQQDTGVALSVDVSDSSQAPASPYWRMLALDDYSEGTFKLSLRLKNTAFERERTSMTARGAARPRRGEAAQWTFYLESGVSRYLPLPGEFEMLRFRDPQSFRLAPELAVVALREEPVTMTAYRVEGFSANGTLPDPGFAKLWRERGAEAPAAASALQLRLGVRRSDQTVLAQWVAEITGGAQLGAAEFARTASEWLTSHHGYSLAPKIPGGENDPLVRWLASREAGHCELFAGSLALLARTAGFPARVITGFRGGTWNAYSNNFTVRNSDAHAWAEIFDAAAGAWLRADPLGLSPADALNEPKGEAALAARTDRSWKARLDSLRVFWYRRIVSFDQRSQADTLKAVKEATQNTGRRVREALEQMLGKARRWLTTPWDARRTMKAGVALLAVAGVVAGWRKFGRAWWRAWRRGKGERRGDPVRREAGRWLGKFAATEGGAAERGAVVAELQRLRFGARAGWPEPEKIFRRARVAWRGARRRARVTRT